MWHVLVFGSLLALFLILITRNVSPEPYGYDEADYMYAASLGFTANWTDTPSMSIADFLRAGFLTATVRKSARSAFAAAMTFCFTGTSTVRSIITF